MPENQVKIKETSEEKPEKSQKKAKGFRNKVVIRRLPPNLTEVMFIESISPMPDYLDLYFVSADWTLGAEATSRAYIEFKNEEDIFVFKDKFDGYVFVDNVRGSEYQAVVEYAAFQGLPKSRARKKDKNVGTIESEQHFLNFLELMKQEEEAEGQKNEPKLEYSYKIKDDKKITSTPLIEFLTAKNQEKRDAKRKKVDDKRKQRDEEKDMKRIQIAKNIPESIKEVKEYDDGIMVRTVSNKLSRNERKKEPKSESKTRSEENLEREQERREKRGKEKLDRETRRKLQREKEDKNRADREQRNQQKMKEQEQKKMSSDVEKSKPVSVEKEANKGPPLKSETKRYSALRKARQEKTSEGKEATDAPPKPVDVKTDETSRKSSVDETKSEKSSAKQEGSSRNSDQPSQQDIAKKEARLKKNQEMRERRAREADERAQRQIKNKDRPSRQIYQPKRRQDNDSKTDNIKSSDESSEASRKKSDNERRNTDTERQKLDPDHKAKRIRNRRDPRNDKRQNVNFVSHEDDAEITNIGDGDKLIEVRQDETVEKLEKLDLNPPELIESSQSEVIKECGDVQE